MGDSTMSHEVEQKFAEIEARLDELEAGVEPTEEATPTKRASKKASTSAPFMEEESS